MLEEGCTTVGPTESKLWVLGERLCVPVQVPSGCVVSSVAQPGFNKHYSGFCFITKWLPTKMAEIIIDVSLSLFTLIMTEEILRRYLYIVNYHWCTVELAIAIYFHEQHMAPLCS